MIELLITSGCSFADGVGKWPTQLATELGVPLSNSGLLSQGNGLISRKIIYQVTRALETIPAENLLVGIMWSGPDRHDFYMPSAKMGTTNEPVDIRTRIGEDTNNCWVILNHHWDSEYAKYYYGMFHDGIASLIYTYEHILRVQWFLKLHNVKYFMTTFKETVFPPKKSIDTHSDIKDLYNQIDFDQFLPIAGQYEWAEQTGILFDAGDPFHPTVEHNVKFTNEVVLPFLENKKYLGNKILNT